jgi:AcrR family transcriptional regulator
MAAELDSPRRQPKGHKRDRTRAQLLEAARALIREKGYEHTTLDAIAERAGMTTGAIYGNFKNRDELFISLGQTYWAPIKPHVQRSTAAVGRLTGLAYTLTHEELRAKVAAFTAQSYALGEQWLRSVTKQEDLPMPANQLVRVIHALTEGLVFQRLLTPELIPDEVFHAAFAALGKKTQKD